MDSASESADGRWERVRNELVERLSKMERCSCGGPIKQGELCERCRHRRDRARELAERKEWVRAHPREALVEYGLPGWLAMAVEQNWPKPETVAHIDGWPLENGIYIWGHQPGNGKTVCLARLCWRYLCEGIRPIWTNPIRIIEEIKRTYRGSSPESEGYVLERYREAYVLLLDDVGVLSGTTSGWAANQYEFERRILYSILEFRDPYRQVTSFTSNFSVDELRDRVDPRIASRIVERAKPCEIAEQRDYRLDRWGQS